MSASKRPDDDWDVTREAQGVRQRKRKADQGPLLPFDDAGSEGSVPAGRARQQEPETEQETMAKKPAKRSSSKKTSKKTSSKARPARQKTARRKPAASRAQRKKSATERGSSEASVSVRKRAFESAPEETQEELPVDTTPPPGVKKAQHEADLRKQEQGQPRDATTRAIDRTARGIYTRIIQGQKPELKSPVRSLSNVSYRKSVGYFEIGRQKKIRTLTVNTVRTFAQSLRMMSLSKDMVQEDTFATKRDAYYQSKNWEDAKFNDQTESDTVMDDIEAMFSLEGVTREQLRFYPEEHGGAVAGELVVVDRDPRSGGTIEIDCARFGSGAYTIPSSVEHLKFKTKAKFVLAIETGGMFQRLQYHAYPSRANCIIVSMGGVPTRACRRFIRRLSDTCKIPVYAFVDCDPYGISNIYRSLKVGSGNAAHINKFFCVPKARFLGVTPDDIRKYKLPTHPLKDVDRTRARDALKNDPFFKTHKDWRAAMENLLKMGVRAEQQALAKWGLNYVMDVYLPAKLKDRKSFLP